jgi:hypothetical protein
MKEAQKKVIFIFLLLHQIKLSLKYILPSLL